MAGCFELGWGSWPAEATMFGSFGEAMAMSMAMAVAVAMAMAAVVEGLAFARGSVILVAVGLDSSLPSSLNSKSDCYFGAGFDSS